MSWEALRTPLITADPCAGFVSNEGADCGKELLVEDREGHCGATLRVSGFGILSYGESRPLDHGHPD
jgi:hypothetical protein